MTERASEETLSSFEQWRDTIMSLVTTAIHQSTTNIVSAIQRRVDAVIHAIIIRVVIAALLLVGGFFFLLALAHFIATVLGYGLAAGYAAVGLLAVLVAVLMRFANSRA